LCITAFDQLNFAAANGGSVFWRTTIGGAGATACDY
jgi:hypothetical protein